MSVEFNDELLESVAKALYEHDIYGHGPQRWNRAAALTRRSYHKFAQVALEAMYGAKVEEEFIVCGAMPIEGHADYEFCSDAMKTLEEAEELHKQWTQQYGDEEGAKLSIKHVMKIELNTFKYWTKADLEEINARAKELAEKLAEIEAGERGPGVGNVE